MPNAERLRQNTFAATVSTLANYQISKLTIHMDAHKSLTIGLFGFGVVGEGLYKVLQQTPSLRASIKIMARSAVEAPVTMLRVY